MLAQNPNSYEESPILVDCGSIIAQAFFCVKPVRRPDGRDRGPLSVSSGPAWPIGYTIPLPPQLRSWLRVERRANPALAYRMGQLQFR